MEEGRSPPLLKRGTLMGHQKVVSVSIWDTTLKHMDVWAVFYKVLLSYKLFHPTT